MATFGISNFASKNVPDPAKLLREVEWNWDRRVPGDGRVDLTKVVLVPLPTEGYRCRTVTATDEMVLKAYVTTRADGEDPYVEVRAVGYKPRGMRKLLWRLGLAKLEPVLPDAAKFVWAVLYSAETLLENGGARSGDFDWEVVAVLASTVEREPMEPLTMARNWLEKPGGTFAPYDVRETMKAIYHWSNRVRA